MSAVGVEELVAELVRRGETVATCESLTAGLVAARLADVPGASAVLRGGLVTYATELKESLVGVDADALAHGVVSREVALAMAAGCRPACGADWGIATTGVAGPGPSDGVPAGTAWVAVVGPTGEAARLVQQPGLGRAEVRAAVVDAALELVEAQLL